MLWGAEAPCRLTTGRDFRQLQQNTPKRVPLYIITASSPMERVIGDFIGNTAPT